MPAPSEKSKASSEAPPAASPEVLIDLKDVYKDFPMREQIIHVLKGIDFQVTAGELVVVFGPSGSGKSTMINIAMGLESPTTGTSLLLGEDVSIATQDERAILRKYKVGVMTQQSHWIKSLDVLGNVAFPLILQGKSRLEAYKKALMQLARFNMTDWRTFIPTELSSGQQQKIGLARALITDPKLIIADEPTGNLDFESGNQLSNLLLDLTKEGRGVVMVTHDLENVHFATRVIRIFDGKIVEDIDMSKTTPEKVKEKLVSYEEFSQQNRKKNREKNKDMGQKNTKDSSQNQKLKSLAELDSEVAEGDQKTDRNDGKVFSHVNLETNNIGVKVEKKKPNLFRFLNRLRKGVNRRNLVKFARLFPAFFRNAIQVLRTMVLVLFTLAYRQVNVVLSYKRFPNWIRLIRFRLDNYYKRIAAWLNRSEGDIVNQAELIDLSLKNIFVKRTRSLVTIGGVAFGISFTVFLVSLGFGLERLVVGEVASLAQLKQIEVSTTASQNIQIDDSTISDFRQIPGVENIYPRVDIAGKINFQESSTDVVVYGVQADYLTNSDLTLTDGEYFAANDLNRSVLGEFTDTFAQDFGGEGDSPQPLLLDSETLQPILDEEAEAEAGQSGSETVDVVPEPEQRVVVNNAFLQTLGLTSELALNREIEAVFVATGNVTNSEEQIESRPVTYEISGVVSNDDVPLIYVPITDVKSMGIDVYSQLRVIVPEQSNVTPVRQQLEVLGYRTSAVLDTVEQIESLFATARLVFSGIGLVALFVASLGMFNTLTVSLLERTKEVGIMKVIGMKSREVKDMFLAEAIVMGLLGGFGGIALGLLFGGLLSGIISLISIATGSGPLSLTFLPVSTALLVLGVAATTGVLTGLYPANRATQISALNALRYE